MGTDTTTLLKLGPLDSGLLEQSGVFREPCAKACADRTQSPLSDSAIALFMVIAAAGEQGVALSVLNKNKGLDWSQGMLELDAYHLILREHNQHGQLTHLSLSWQGRDALDRARAQSHSGPGGTEKNARFRRYQVTGQRVSPAKSSMTQKEPLFSGGKGLFASARRRNICVS